MIAAAVTKRLGLMTREAGHDDQLIAKWLQRRECPREREIAAGAAGKPVVVNDAVRVIHDTESTDRAGGRLHLRRQRRDHRVEERQGYGSAHSAKHRAPRNRLLGDD